MEAQEIVKLLEKNYQLIGETNAKWLDKRVRYLLARIFTGKASLLSPEDFNWLDTALSRKSGIFTSLTRISRHTLTGVMLANQVNTVDDIEEVYFNKNLLKESGFKASSSTYFAAYQMLVTTVSERNNVSEKAFKLYQELKKRHPFITNLNDYSSVVSLAQSKLLHEYTEEQICEIVEFYFNGFKEIGLKSNESCLIVATLATLMLGDENTSYLETFQAIVKELENRKIKIRNSHFVSLASVAFFEHTTKAIDFDEFVTFIEEVGKSISMIFETEYKQALGISLYAENISKKIASGSFTMVTVAWNELIVEEQTMLISNATTFIGGKID